MKKRKGDGLHWSELNVAHEVFTKSFSSVDPASRFLVIGVGWIVKYGDAKIAYLYTAANDDQDLAISIQGLKISHVDKGSANEDETVERTYFADGVDFQTTVAPEAGKNHHILLNVVESALTSEGVQWGRSNLYYRGDNGGGRDYAFYAKNELNPRADGFFGFGGTLLAPLRRRQLLATLASSFILWGSGEHRLRMILMDW